MIGHFVTSAGMNLNMLGRILDAWAFSLLLGFLNSAMHSSFAIGCKLNNLGMNKMYFVHINSLEINKNVFFSSVN